MSRSAPLPFTVVTALLVLLTALLLFACRSSDNLPEEKAVGSDPLWSPPSPPADLSSESVTIAPLAVFEDPALLIAGNPVQQEELSPKDGASQTAVKNDRPRIAIIIDDMGFHQALGHQFLQLELNLTFSFLPEAPYTAELQEAAFQLGRDILVHLPMEPKKAAWNPGADGLSVQDGPRKIREKMARMLDAVPRAIGANNHMGSRFTENERAMGVVIETLRQKSLFFIDSCTTAGSRGTATAQRLGVPVARRHVFLDNDRDPQKICQQIEQLVALAQRQGSALGIGHPHGAMFMALTQCGRDGFREVEIVGVHQMVQ